MKSCNDCVFFKWYMDYKNNTSFYACDGVMDGMKMVKKFEKLTDLSKAEYCEYYDDYSWLGG